MTSSLASIRFFFSAILIAMMVIVPIAEAASCALEGFAPHAHADAGSSPQPSDDGDAASHGSCSHNHCHHVIASLGAAVSQIGIDARAIVPDMKKAELFSRTPDELTKPPRG